MYTKYYLHGSILELGGDRVSIVPVLADYATLIMFGGVVIPCAIKKVVIWISQIVDESRKKKNPGDGSPG